MMYQKRLPRECYISNVIARCTIALLVLLLSYSVQAPVFAKATSGGQDQQVIDSLNQAYSKAKHDTDKITSLFALSDELIDYVPDTTLIINKIALAIAERNLTSGHPPALHKKYSSSLATALNNFGYIYDVQGDIPKALEYYHKSLKIEEKIGDKEGIATSLNNFGSIYHDQGDIQKALEYYHKSLIIYEEIGNKEGIAMSFGNIAYSYEHQGDIPKALEYYHKSLKIREDIGHKLGMASCYNNIGAIYSDQGDTSKALDYLNKCLKLVEEIGYKDGIGASLQNIGGIYLDQGDIPKALEYYHKSLIIQEEIGNKRAIANSLHNIGFTHKNQGDYPKALEYLYKSLKIQEEIGNKSFIANSLQNIGYVYMSQGELTNAFNYGLRGLEIAREIGSPRWISDNSGLLSKVAKKQGNYEEALEMYELHIQMRDSIKNEATQKATIRQQTKYEFEKAQLIKEQEEKEKARLEAEVTGRRDNLQYSVILIALLVLFGGVLGLGFINVSERMAEGIIFFSFLILFEFLLVLADPYIDNWSGGAPGIKLLFNAGIAALIFPLHSLFETKLKKRLAR